MSYFCRIFVFVVISQFFANLVLAKESLQVVTENWYPYNFQNEHGNIVGQSTDRVIQVLNRAEVDYSLALYPWTRAFNLATSSPNVLIYTILRTPDREALFHWICPLADKNIHQLYRLNSRNDIKLETEQDIKNYSVVVTRETFLHKLMLELGLSEEHNLHLTADDDINAALFLAGKVDILPAFESAINHVLDAEGLNRSFIRPVLTLSANHYPDYCMALSKSTPINLVEKVRQAHQRISS